MYHFNAREWHRNELTLLRRHVQKGATALDIGANLGFMAVVLAGLVGREGRILCFEPSPRTFHKLQRMIELNDLDNVAAHNVGCGDRIESAPLYDVGETSGHASLIKPESARRAARKFAW